MNKREKVKKIFENVQITDTSSEGMAVGRIEDFVVFVKGAVPGDVANVRVNRFKKSFAEGEVTEIVSPSPDRVKAPCTHFGTCGGCKWQHLSYTAQLRYKQKTVQDALSRLAKIENPVIEPIKGSSHEYFYRNKLDFTFSSKKWLSKEVIDSGEFFGNRNGLGFHLPGLFDKVLDIDFCHLQPSPSNEIRTAVRKYANEKNLSYFDIREKKGLLRNLIIRTSSTNEVMVLFSFFENQSEEINGLLQYISEEFPGITSLQYVINGKANETFGDLPIHTFTGRDFIYEEMEGVKFRIGPKSFYQTNSSQAYELYKKCREFAGLTGNEIVYDLYTGTGTIANFIAANCKSVVGIEFVPEAIEDAKENARINKITNADFYSGDMKDLLTEELFSRHGKPDVVITDPPRAGMHPDVCKTLLNCGADRIMYVSCNPATQARDIQLLSDKYVHVKSQPVDMFPQTHHIENIALLKKKNEPRS